MRHDSQCRAKYIAEAGSIVNRASGSSPAMPPTLRRGSTADATLLMHSLVSEGLKSLHVAWLQRSKLHHSEHELQAKLKHLSQSLLHCTCMKKFKATCSCCLNVSVRGVRRAPRGLGDVDLNDVSTSADSMYNSTCKCSQFDMSRQCI